MQLKYIYQCIFKSNQSLTLWVLYILIFSINTSAQQAFEFKHLQEKNGLSYNIVNCFLKDKDGFLWVGTYDGLNRFDGNHFSKFKKDRHNQNSILSNVIHDLAQDQDGNIWYSTPIGIGFFNQKNNTFTNFQRAENRELGDVYNIHCDKAGDIWFSVPGGLFRYFKKSKKFELFKNDGNQKSSFLDGGITKNGLLQDPIKDGLWMTHSKGLMYLDIKTKQFFHYKNNPQNLPFFKNQETTAISIGNQNQLIFGSGYNELTIIDIKKLQVIKKIHFSAKQVNKYNVFATTFIDGDQKIWVSTWQYKIFSIDGKTYEIKDLPHSEGEANSIAGDFFWDAMQDEGGTLFFGTVNGISYTSPKNDFYKLHKVSKQHPELVAENDNINFFYEDDDSWLFGTHFQGIYRYNPVNNETQRYRISASINYIKKFQNIYYLGCNEGFFTFDFKKNKLTQLKLPAEIEKNRQDIYDIQVENDSILWLASIGKYVIEFNIKTQKMTAFNIKAHEKAGKRGAYLPYVIIDNNKEKWVTTARDGLLKFSKKEQRFIPIKSLENNDFEINFRKPKVDKDNNFWLSTSGNGLVKYEPKRNKFTLWSESDGLISDLALSNEFDNFGKIWVSAYNKISIFNPENESFQNFTLPVSESNYQYTNHLFKLKNGHILSLMKGTLVEFLPEKIHNNFLKNTPLITQLAVVGSAPFLTKNGGNLNLEVGQNNFTITFGYLPLTNHNPYQYSYKLEGFNKDWQNVGIETYANFANLSGGDYVFKVKVFNGNTASKISQIKIHIATVFYKTWWFLTLLALSVFGLIYAFYRYRLNQAARFHIMQVHTSALEKDKTEIQYQNLINHLNPHFLFNSLTSLNSLIAISPTQASNFLEKLSLIYRYILQNKEKEWVSLGQELDFVQHYIDLQKSRFEEGLQIHIDISEKHFSRNIVPVTIQNLIENAIKHNIIDDETPLLIDLFVENDYLFVKNNLQKKQFVETSNKQGLESLRNLYKYLVSKPMEILETDNHFIIKVPLF